MNTVEKILTSRPLAAHSGSLKGLLCQELSECECEIKEDALGNLYFTKKFTEGKKVMLCTHFDVPGVIVTFVDESKIYVGGLGKADVRRLAYTKVVFDGICGILVVPEDYSSSTAISDCYVETYDKSACEKVTAGDKGYFDMPVYCYSENMYSGFGVPIRACIATLYKTAKEWFLHDSAEKAKKMGIGSLTVAFLGQSSLNSRGAFVASNVIQPDEIILISPFDTKKDTCGITKDTKAVVKMLDKAFVCDKELADSVCQYFEENSVSYKKAVNYDTDPALLALSRADSTPRCCEIGLPVFSSDMIFI
ncbi:MAG: hypothetical protein J6K12_05370 [Clostridia bacterium]|nr:hypothetical protein [Clostridia bacterium]